MNVYEFEKNLYNLLINHLNKVYKYDEYIELLKIENNSILNYVLSHAFFENNDLDNAEKYRNIAINLNSNFTFEKDYQNIFLYIYYLLSTITTIESPFIDDEIDIIIKNNPKISDFIKASETYRNNNDIGNAVRITNIGINQYPNDETLKYEMASNLLYSRNVDNAWYYNEMRFDYYRKKLPQFIDRPKFELQRTSAKVYIYPVTKLGDTIFFVRYVIKLKQDYPKLILFVTANPALKTLFEENGINVYEKVDKSMIDYQISFEGLPYLFKNNSKILNSGYLKSNSEKTKLNKENYFNNNKKKVGIIWKTSKADDDRNINLNAFERLFENKNIQFYSLQKDITLKEELYLAKYNVVNIGTKIKDFSDTASFIENLDLVIGCDTSVTNLSGAMNKKTLLIVPYHSDWRWGLFEENSEWYNSVKIYRKNQNNDISEVISRIKNFIE